MRVVYFVLFVAFFFFYSLNTYRHFKYCCRYLAAAEGAVIMGTNLKINIHKRKLNDNNNSIATTNKRFRRNSCGSTDSNYSIETVSDTISDVLINNPAFTTNKKESSTSIDAELLGPCKSGSPIQLEGIVWSETSQGVLVLNVTWKGKTFIGALMDTTNNGWAPPVFNNKFNINENRRLSSSLDEEQHHIQDPSIRMLRNGKRRYLGNVKRNNKKT